MLDGPIKSEVFGKHNVKTTKISKFGKQFSVVEVPYSFKLLMHELGAMNVQMRLITTDNISILKEKSSSLMFEDILERVNNLDSGVSEVQEVDIEESKETKDTDRDVIDSYNNDNRELQVKVSDRVSLPSDMEIWLEYRDDVDKDAYISPITNEEGDFEFYFMDDPTLNGNPPNFYPKMWDFDVVKKHELPPYILAESLRSSMSVDDNWNKITKIMIGYKKIGKEITNPIILSDEEPNGYKEKDNGVIQNRVPENKIQAADLQDVTNTILQGNTTVQNNVSSPLYAPGSPAYQPQTNSPQYQPGSPVYQPQTNSPQYQPMSPSYQPQSNSPPYQPGSPQFNPNLSDENNPTYEQIMQMNVPDVTLPTIPTDNAMDVNLTEMPPLPPISDTKSLNDQDNTSGASEPIGESIKVVKTDN